MIESLPMMRKMSGHRAAFLLVTVLSGGIPPLMAQISTATVVGTVRDAAGGVVVGAKVDA